MTVAISYPKSGRTWFRVMMGKYICEIKNMSDSKIFKLKNPFYTHGFVPQECHFSEMKKNMNFYQGENKIIIVRNIMDVIVSYYFHKRDREKIFDKDISCFIRNENFGVKKIVEFYNIWNNYLVRNNDKYIIVKYENLHKNAFVELSKVINFMDLEYDEKKIKKSVLFASFNNMRSMEEKNYFKAPQLSKKK